MAFDDAMWSFCSALVYFKFLRVHKFKLNFRESLNLEDSVNSDALDCFHFPLNEITEECIVKVVEWLRNHQGF